MNETDSMGPIDRLALGCLALVIRFIIFLAVVYTTDHFFALFGLNFLAKNKPVVVHDCPTAMRSNPLINGSISAFSFAPKR